MSTEACPYDGHRPSDWRLRDSRLVVCGVCHPPAAPLIALDLVARRPS